MSTGAAETIARSKAKGAFFPATSDKQVAYWLLGSAASVFGIVIFGGLTRLTESGYYILFDPIPGVTLTNVTTVSA
jgi:heme a synthase